MKIGDKVLYKDEVGGGVITQISNNQAYVEEETGFGDWFQLSELIHKEELYVEAVSLKEIEIKEGDGKGSSKPHSKNHLSRLEVDLHLEAFLDNARGLSNHDKVELQLKEARKAFSKAKRQQFKYLHLIHGKGSGKLRQELHLWLNHQNELIFTISTFLEIVQASLKYDCFKLHLPQTGGPYRREFTSGRKVRTT